MAVSFKHLFQSPKGDPADTTLVRPSNWNAEHVITMAANMLLGCITGGNAVEIPCTAFGRSIISAADFNAMALAAGFGVSTTGDLKLTLKGAPDAGWRMLDDGTIGDASSGANYANDLAIPLFTLIYDILPDALAPLYTNAGGLTSRGSAGSAVGAVNAHFRISLPKTLGRALAVAGAGSGLSIRSIAQYIGTETVTLDATMIPTITPTFNGTPMTAGLSGLTDLLISSGVRVQTGTSSLAGNQVGGGLRTDSFTPAGSIAPFGGGQAHSNVQPTTFFNAMIKL